MATVTSTQSMSTTGTPPRYALVRPVAAPGVPTPGTATELEPDREQRRVVEHSVGPLLVLAGPGTGKTTMLQAAVTERVRRGADPSRVLVLTFGRRAAATLRHGITRALGNVADPPLARTFHGYAFGLLRAQAAARGHPAPRLLSGPEQDLLIRELLAGDAAGTGVAWPVQLWTALRTRGFATQLRDLLSRTYERGIDPVKLDRWGAREGRPEWRAAAAFMQQYADVTELRDASLAAGTAYDPAELIRAAITMLRRDRELLAQQRRQCTHVYVDEFHDCDPAQEELLQLLAGGGRFLVAFADPDQSVYGFRGADPDCVRRFGERFATTDGGRAPTLPLRTCYRSDQTLLPVFARLGAHLKGSVAHRELHASQPADDGSGVLLRTGADVHVLASVGQETALIVAELRRAHLLHGVPWEAMVVVVRSASRSLSTLRRAMLSAGVPVGGAQSQLSLAEQPGAAPLLWLLRCALTPGGVSNGMASDVMIEALLLTELGAADPVGLRRLRQALRARAAVNSHDLPASSNGLLADAVAQPWRLDGIDPRFSAPARRIARLIDVARKATTAPDATAETVLWKVWHATGLAQRWQACSAQGGSSGAAADRNLDAVIELCEAAERFSDRMPGAKLELFLDHLQGHNFAADTFAPDRADAPGVRLLTAHATKGLQWDLVIVAGVQEDLWPDLRLRGGVLGAADLVELAAGRALDGKAARAAAYQQLLDEERRLFYVAVTRARRRLLVTAVADEDNQPSRFLDDITGDGIAGDHIALKDIGLDRTSTGGSSNDAGSRARAGQSHREIGEAPATLSLPSLVAQLRRVVTEPELATVSSPLGQHRRRAAAAVLAQLAAAGVSGADPEQWWGLRPSSDDRPLIEPTELVSVSPSALESFTDCGLRWLLERRAGGGTEPGIRQQIGTVVHEVAADAGSTASAPELQAMLRAKLELVDLGNGWTARRERERAEQMIEKLAVWLANNSRRFVAAEEPFEVEVGRAQLRGRVDRLEADERGRLYVVDFKTGSSSPSGEQLREHPQLGAYQLAIARGGLGDGTTQPGGAALVQLAKNKRATEQLQPPLGESENPKWPVTMLTAAADGMSAASFLAVHSSSCRNCPIRPSCPLHSDQTTAPPLPADDLDESE